MKYKLPIQGKWMSFSDEDLHVMVESGDVESAEALRHWIVESDKNPIGNFNPHGMRWHKNQMIIGKGALVLPPSAYEEKWGNDGTAFINDWKNGFCIILAPNQVGKTFHAAAKTLLATCRCEKDWPIFKYNGVEYVDFEGPKTWIVGSYSWDNVKTIWNRIRELAPRRELREWSPSWGKYEGEHGKQKDLNFGDGKPKHIDLQYSGSRIIFLCYTQLQMHWEGFASDGLTADEQIPEEKWVGWSRSTRTRGFAQSIHALTGHVLEDRPDTGAAGWFKREVWDGVNTRGRTVGRYHISIESVPDAIISKEKKKEAWTEWVDPNMPRTEKQERAAIARYWGGWEEGSGRVLDEFQRNIHVINPIWKGLAPKDWTKWRVVDYGDNGVTCVGWIAIGPKGWGVVYRLLYERGLLVAQTSKMAIEMSGNRQVKLATDINETTGETYTLYEEIQEGEQFYGNLLDSRSAAQDKQGQSLIQLFSRYGFELTEACGQRDNIQIPRLKDWLRIDWTKPHPFRKNEDGTPALGCPRLFFFDGCCENMIREIESLQKDPNDPGKLNKKNDTHAIDVLKYWASDSPGYMGDVYTQGKEEKEYDFKRMFTLGR